MLWFLWLNQEKTNDGYVMIEYFLVTNVLYSLMSSRQLIGYKTVNSTVINMIALYIAPR